MKEIQPFFVLLLFLSSFLTFSHAFSPRTADDRIGKIQMESKPLLPKIVGIWTRPKSPKIINAKNIFDYMDGAGELYLAYRFHQLESYEYQAESQKEILVELYFMGSSDDAFGLLSLDWGGEPVMLNLSSQEHEGEKNLGWPRALYGEGLLRIWSDAIYARVMATQETPESKKAVLELGRAIVKGRPDPPAPVLIEALPGLLRENWKLRKDRAGYLRSHLVLNSLYYLSHENMLDLDHDTEAVTAPYERQESLKSRSRIQFLTVKYTHPEQAQRALAHFHQVYLVDYPLENTSKSSGNLENTFAIEDGWLGYKLKGTALSVIFECPDRETAQEILNQI